MRFLIAVALAAFGAQVQTRHAPIELKLKDSTGSSVGTVLLRETIDHRLNIDIRLKGVPPGEHAIHIHENAVCDGGVDFRSAGKHLDPDGRQHGTENPLGHHLGDLPQNIAVDASWTGSTNFTVSSLSLTPGTHGSILGRSVVLHEQADDFKTDPGGGSGNRIACGVIPTSLP